MAAVIEVGWEQCEACEEGLVTEGGGSVKPADAIVFQCGSCRGNGGFFAGSPMSQASFEREHGRVEHWGAR